jgi:hypothetical protein
MFDHVHPSNEPLIPGIYSTKALVQQEYDYRLQCAQEHIHNFRHHAEEFQAALKKVLEELYSPSIPFVQTTNENKCKYCNYTMICRKDCEK